MAVIPDTIGKIVRSHRFATGFFCLILAGASGLLFPEQLTQENRHLAETPRLHGDLRQFTKDAEAYVNDHFGMRSLLVTSSNLLQTDILGETETERVWIGKDGWLFLRSPEIAQDIRGTNLFDEEELRQWKDHLDARSSSLASRNIRYLFVIVPDKHTIYPEHLPDSIVPTGKQRIAQLADYLREYSVTTVLNLTTAINDAKASQPLYLKLDTHWASRAAFAAHRAIIQALGLPIRLREGDMAITREIPTLAVLARFLALEDAFTKEYYDVLRPENPTAFVAKPEGPENDGSTLITRSGDATLPKALIYRDSFGDQLAPFLAEYFSQAVFIRKPKLRDISTEDLALYDPDIVMEIISENKLLTIPIPPIDNFAIK